MGKKKAAWEDLVPISQARLQTWIGRTGLAQAEIARRAKVSPQTLNYLVTGKHQTCRRDVRRRLARILGVSIGFLSGEGEAPSPGPYDAIFAGYVDDEKFARVVPINVNGPEEAETRAGAEQIALLLDLARVFFPPSPPSKEGNRTTYEPVFPGMNRLNGSRYVFLLHTLRVLIAGGSDEGLHHSEQEADRFAEDMGRVFRTILEPWASGRLPKPPAGTIPICTLASVATGLAIAMIYYDTTTVNKAVVALQELAEMLNLSNYGRRSGNSVRSIDEAMTSEA